MFRATKGSGVTITTILRNNAIETRPGNQIHHLRGKRSSCVHCAPDWKTRIGEDVTSRLLDRVQGATKKTHQKPLSCSVMLKSYPPSTGQQCFSIENEGPLRDGWGIAAAILDGRTNWTAFAVGAGTLAVILLLK